MPLAIPPELKKINPFVRRAEELDRDKSSPESRLVAYYCRQYAVHIGIPLAGSSPAAKTCLGHLLGALEKEKPVMDTFTREEAALLCRKFANQVFDKADEEDRAGNASKDTAKAFYAAASFLQILEQFSKDGSNDTSEDAQEDRKRILYSKWKATDILKALKEGRTPTPGGYSGDADILQDDASNEKDINDALPPAVETVHEEDAKEDEAIQPTAPAEPPSFPEPLARPPAPEVEEDNVPTAEEEEPDDEGIEVPLGPPPAYPGEPTNSARADRPSLSFELPPTPSELPPPVIPPPASSDPAPAKKSGFTVFGRNSNSNSNSNNRVKNNKPIGKVSKTQFDDATELTRFALAALQNKDASLAVERLEQALEALGR